MTNLIYWNCSQSTMDCFD